jgi:DNA repair protein RadC
MSKDDGELHKNHRQRVRDRYLNYGLDCFDDHTVLEMLLFYVIPRKDTNPLAHRLINRFGSLSAVFAADYDDIIGVEGAGPAVASFIRSFADSMRYISLDQMADLPLNNVQRMGEYMRRWFSCRPAGYSAALLLDKSMKPQKIFCLTKGHGIGARDFSEKIISEATEIGAKTVVIGHNHTDGRIESSPDDRRTTRILFDDLKNEGICLAEHFIVCGTDCVPILREIIGEDEIGDMIKIYRIVGDDGYDYEAFV